ncbi:PH and SEC7 domain-containing protein isoform X3 [Drosophila eugracilis]|uniref:PH and SEC7 domain-containing protein isoform X3 n=1 Tax=Drosophila eugracilis TaxID=29029 RepID=UPI0007E794FF|nr:PH and SEC7 domain-containing protein isoform X3 [Drosophila eugracilis]
MSEELKVVLRRSEQHSGFGFSLLGTTGPPHVIYDIVENSPAADCGAVEAGDVILKVNGTDVHRYTTKQVLKCLRLSEQLVTLELKRDPKLKARIKEQLANTQSPHYVDIESPNIYDYNSSSTNSSPNHRPNTGGKGVATTPSQSGLRYKSPTHLPSLRQNSSPLLASGSTTTTTTATHTHTHSRNSSASSTKIKVVETSITTSTTGIVGLASPTGSAGGEATSPTFRPSRIPQALTKCAVPKPVPVLHSPQNKRPRPSQIPTKASNGNGNGHTPQLPPQSLQHSNSYSGSPVTRQRFTDREQEREPEPNSAPPQPAKAPRFEAYMMTGDLILNLSRTPQTSNPLPAQTKKVDSLRDSPSRPINSRINGALAPRASGESSPTSSSSVDSPINTSSDSVKREAKLLQKQQQQQQQQPHQQQQQRDSINNSYNRKDSLTNDTLLMCEELEQDEEGEYVLEEDNKQQRQRQQQHRYRQQQNQQRYEYYQNEDELEEQEEVEEEREEDQTHYDITNIETYQSGLGRGDEDDSDRQCLVDDDDDDDAYDDEENDAGDEDYSTNSLGSGSAKQRLRALKQRTATRQQQRNRDAVDCAGRSGSGSSSTTVKSEAGGLGLDETSFSVPTSPISLSTPLIDKETANSVPTSPEPSSLVPESSSGAGAGAVVVRRHNGHVVRKCDAAGFRTSKSEDHLQQIQREGIAAVIPIDIDEDVNSSLNTLLDTRQDSEDSQASDRDRIVWTYNAPLQPHQLAALQRQQQQQEQQFQQQQQQLQQQHMQQQQQLQQQHQQQQQQQQQLYGGMVLSDPSDSDSTILVSDAAAQQRQQLKQQLRAQQQQQRDRERERDRDRDREREQSEHKVVIQVRGLDSNSSGNGNNTRSEEDGFTLTEGPLGSMTIGMLDASPPVSDDGSDVESLHSYHYSPKAVDMPSAIRLAKRLYSLDGFKKSDVSRHLSKNNDFSRAVADEYLKHFTFEKKSLDQALREFLQQFSLSGETQERERVLVHFSKRFLDCNPGTFNSQDAVHTLTCAIMLLNTDLHGQNMNRKMSCAEFVDNLADLNDGENFPKDVLKSLYQAIKTKPLEWALDEEAGDLQQQRANNTALGNVGQNPFLDPPELATAVEYKKGYVMRKCCYDSSFKKTPFGKRSWKMFYCTLRDLVLYLHKDEHGFRKSQMSDNLHNAIRIHHALATKANDYTKKQHVFRLQTADQAEYLFQTSDSKELQSWVETINYVCAAISAPPLEGGVGSQKRFQRPLLPSKQSKLLLKEQLDSHEVQLAQLDQELNEHKKGPIPSKGLALQNYKEKESYLQYELRRYRTYVSILSAKMLADQQQLELQAQQPTPAAHEEEADTFPVGNPACTTPTPQSINQKDQQKEPHQQPTNRWFDVFCCCSPLWRHMIHSKSY